MWTSRESPLDELDSVDPDVVPAEGRRTDLGIPDGVWWVGSFIAAVVSAMALSDWIGARFGDRPALIVFFGWSSALVVFATARWGHRRYTVRRALRDAAGILLTTAGAACLWILWGAFRR